jgi:hypothetical protein
MPNFLQNSMDGFRRGWEQQYGSGARRAGPAVVPVSQNPAIGAPIGAKEPELPPVSRNPEVGQPLSGDASAFAQPNYAVPQQATQEQSPGQPAQSVSPANQFVLPWWLMLAAAQAPRSGSAATPMAYNPEVGQPLSGDSGGDGGFNFLSWLQNLLGGGQQQSAPVNAPLLNPDTQVGPATPTMPQAAQTSGGVATSSPGIDAANAANTSFGGGGGAGGAGGMGGSILSGLGSSISNFGKNQPNFQYNPGNIPLPQRVTFVPPNLSPNQNVSY